MSTLCVYAEVTINGLTYELDKRRTGADFQYVDGCATVTGSSNSNPSSVTIPATVTYQGVTYKVVSIDDMAFYHNQNSTTKSNLKTVTIGSNVEYIGYGAFQGTSIQSVTIPASVKEIGSNPYTFGQWGAFAYCESLKTVTFKSTKLRHIPIMCFMGTAITSITIPDGVTHVDLGAFSGCTSLTKVTFPSTLHYIGYSAFNNCSALTSITIPSGCHIIDAYAFYNCINLSSVTLPSSLVSIGVKAFHETKMHTNFKESSNTTYSVNKCLLFGQQATKQQGNYLETIDFKTIPSGTVLIAGEALEYLTGSPSMPSTVKYIGAQPKLRYLNASNGIYYVGDCLIRATSDASATVNVKSGTRVIADRAFSAASNVTTISLPSSVKYVGVGSVMGKTVNIPNSLISAGDSAFLSSKFSINALPTSLTYIGDAAFDGNNSYTVNGTINNISITSSITYWGENAFAFCGISDISIASGFTYIPKSAFNCADGIRTISLPQTITAIGDSAFTRKLEMQEPQELSQMKYVKELIIPNSVKSIGDVAFQRRFIENLTIGSSVAEIGFEAFDMYIDLPRALYSEFNPTLTFISSTPPKAYCKNGNGAAFSYYDILDASSKSSTNVFVPCDAISAYTSQCWMQSFNAPSGRKYYLHTQANDQTMGVVIGGGYISICDNPVTILAQPAQGYKFDSWSDGQTDNPRFVTIECDTTFTALFVSNSQDLQYPTNNEGQSCRKYLRNGHVVIVRNNQVYSIYGTKIEDL